MELYQDWYDDKTMDLDYIEELLDKFPSQWVVRTCFMTHPTDEQDLFAEQVVLTYCLNRGLIKKDKNGNYYDNSKNIEQMPEMNFEG